MAILIEVNELNVSSSIISVKDYFHNKNIYMDLLYVNSVVELYSRSTDLGFDMFAIVFDGISKFKHIRYANQDTYLPNNAWIDVPKSIVNLYQEELQRRKKEYCKLLFDIRKSYKGLTLKIVKGTKDTIGIKGYCIWNGISKFGKPRVGIKDKFGVIYWVNAENCEISNGD